MTTTIKRQTKKTILDWSEIDAVASTRRRLVKQTEISSFALARAERMFGPEAYIGQIDERVLAQAGQDCIALMYLVTPKECAIDESKLQRAVHVYPAAGGRTTYSIDQSVNGWFANRWLPLNASERTTRSGYQHKVWFNGQSGVYVKGTGPYYPDAGPECMNLSFEQFVSEVDALTDAPEKWREAVKSVAERVTDAVRPFRDSVIRYELREPGDRYCLGGYYHSSDEEDYEPAFDVPCRWGCDVRIKSPCTPYRGDHTLVGDFAVQIGGSPLGCEDPVDVMYGAQVMYPQGSHHSTTWRQDEDMNTGLPFAVSRSPVRIIEAARQWAASKIYIPCGD